jgi:hypothetical protein
VLEIKRHVRLVGRDEYDRLVEGMSKAKFVEDVTSS